jgi:hypothetical protein
MWAASLRLLAIGSLVCLALGGCNLIRGEGAGPGSRIGSTEPAAPTPYPGKPSPPAGLATATPQPIATTACTASGLQVAWLKEGGYQGDDTETLELAPSTASACYLATPPTMQVVTESGAEDVVADGDYTAQRLDIESGQAAMLLFGSPAACSATPQVATHMSLAIPGGGSLQVSGLNLDVACGAPTLLIFDVTDYIGATAG